jgi:hypothetical protein
MDLDEAKEYLSSKSRYELRDHSFGDVEVNWSHDQVSESAGFGYFGKTSDVSIMIGDNVVAKFSGEDACALRECGTLARVERNDETGPDQFVPGQTMPGLTREGVFKELCGGDEYDHLDDISDYLERSHDV